ncbi:MAG: ubiquinone-dependent pyruvate dehydrogenase [Rhodanobacteraceae bacterium]|nr:MAG: ubiquinone-dependent pyruvate dehydrogenase [Rhodanobacteraceae bacterium]
MAKRKVADIVIEALEQAGAKHCYGVVGDTLNHVTDAIRRSSKMDWVHVRHEEVGAFAAGAEAYFTGRLAVCAGSCGPGSLHFINGIYESHRNRAPVVLIASQVATTELGIEFPQEVEFRPIYKHCSVFCETIWIPSQARRMATLAAQAALTKRGVAVLVLPGDIAATDTEEGPSYTVHTPEPVTRPSDAELDRIAAVINAGKKIAVYAGAGCERAHDQVVRFCETLKAPMAHTSRAKDFVEYDNPCNVGMTGVFGSKAGFQAVTGCDTLVLLGCDFAWRQFYPKNARVVQVDIDASHLGRRHPVEVGVVGDIAPTLDALQARLQPRQQHDFLDECLTLHTKAQASLQQQAAPGRNGLIHPQQLGALLDRYAADDAIFTGDGGSPMVWVLRCIHVNGKRRTLTSLLHGTMANAMPQALGAKRALPARQVIALCGDGGLTMLLGDLLTAVQENIAVKIVVFNNGTLGFVELEMKVEGLLDSYTELKNPDFGKLADVMGLRGWTVERNEQLESAMQAFLAHDGPALLDVHVNRNELVMPPRIEPAMAVGTVIYGAKAILDGRARDVVEMVDTNLRR